MKQLAWFQVILGYGWAAIGAALVIFSILYLPLLEAGISLVLSMFFFFWPGLSIGGRGQSLLQVSSKPPEND